MSDKVVSSSGGGIGFCGVLTIVFIVLKLTHVIEWSWLWVLSPMWIPFMIAIMFVAIIFCVLIWLGK